ncbi:MAG TPA: OmpA family protein [Bacteroidales bacterium]|nr:OmpA family protein [Bacteroidales bacterium]HOK75353.1 OmpA family protein [Bacteroidales bacterium]HOM39278.1 OmpA family protein [Bacteroidales bacterium]HPP92918.1 OmpA family protein [Bacteroidales bacterium]
MKKRILILLLLILVASPAFSQKRRANKAYEFFRAGEYYEAIDQFKNAYSKTRDRELKDEMIFMVAECYRLVNDPRNAELWYKRAVRSAYSRPEAQYWLADALKKNGKYQQAIEEFKKYKQLVPSDARADREIRACELADEWLRNPESYRVEELKDLNSRYSDFSPAYGRDDFGVVYFTSSREGAQGKKTHGATGQSFADIFESRLDKKGKWSLPVPVESLNSEFEEGTPNLTPDFKEIYFTRCEAGKREKKGCVIMHSVRKGEGWDDPKNIGLLADTLVAAHPAISPDGLAIYFVSDIPGGYGGKDIWYVTRDKPSGSWSGPKNAGPDINTPGDEVFPYVRNDGVLFFSSDGHIGMGGLDIFKATPQPDGTWIVQNMRPPINSSADDFGIVFQGNSESGIFSSTRKGRMNDELYYFERPPLRFSVTGLVKDEKTGAPIPAATVQLIASDGANLQTETGTGGDFKFTLRPNVDYILLASKKNYLNGKERVTTKGQEKSRDFMVTILLSSIERPIELPNIYYDFDRWELRPESMVSLDKLVETLNDNPNVTIELMSHTDSRASDEYNLELSQKRAQSVVDYLVSKGIDIERLSAKGYGESMPKVVDADLAAQYPFLKQGVTLTEQYINSLANDEQREIAHQINRRTEFRVLRTDYEPKKK